jgi:predicted transporter
MKMTVVAAVAFLFNTFLFATYYAVSKEAMGRIDPVVFNFFVMASLIPVGVVFIAFSWRDMNREVIKSGALMGSCLCLGLCTLRSMAFSQPSAPGSLLASRLIRQPGLQVWSQSWGRYY